MKHIKKKEEKQVQTNSGRVSDSIRHVTDTCHGVMKNRDILIYRGLYGSIKEFLIGTETTFCKLLLVGKRTCMVHILYASLGKFPYVLRSARNGHSR